jgi:predicted MPP superfamily phosphohydrolase
MIEFFEAPLKSVPQGLKWELASPTNLHFTDFVLLPMMAGAQCAIAWLALRRAWQRYSKWTVGLMVLGFLVVGATFVVGALSEFFLFEAPLARTFGWRSVGVVKLVTFLWCFCSTPAVALYFLARFAASRVSPEHQPERRKLIVTAGKLAVAAPFVIAGYGATWGRTGFGVQEIEIPVANLPRDLERLRIVQISDLHLGPFLSESQLARVIDASNELRPDIALVTGDLISARPDPVDLALKQCGRLRADRILGCLGNHEAYAQLQDYVYLNGAKRCVYFLRMQAETLRFGSADLNIGGVDYQPFYGREHYLSGAESLIRPGAVNILLSHNPDVFPVAARQGWDLTLSGHTHGGQVTVEILNQTLNLARVYTPYVSGFYQKGRASCYVTRGIGTIGIPARIGAPPEITLIRLVKGPSV